MASSTSNSEEPNPPPAPWRKIVPVVVVLAALTAAGVEYAARSIGFQPTLQDDADLWCSVRAKVRPDDRSQVVLIGTSRIEMDVDLGVLGKSLGTDAPLQLAAMGSSSIPTLKHFAEQTTCNNTFVCDVVPGHYFHMSTFDVGKQQLYVDHWDSRPAVSPIERSLATFVQSHVSLRLLASSLDEDGHKWFLTRRKPVPPFVQVLPDRSISGDFSQVKHIDALRAAQQEYLIPCRKRPINQSELDDNFRRVESWTQMIQSRGGRVVFVRLPVSKAMLAAEQGVFPRPEFWDRFAASSSGVCIHFADYESLAAFDCPDGSHLDGRDRAAFTRAFGEVLKSVLAAASKK